MRALYVSLCRDEGAVITAYAKAEREGRVSRPSNDHKISAEKYAMALLRHGFNKGWLT